MSGHSWVLNQEPTINKVINQQNWTSINEALIKEFHEAYDEYLSTFDAFFVGYPAAFLLLFAKYKKPIIVSNCVRYDLPFCWNNDYHMLNLLNNTITNLYKEGNLLVVSNNLGDHDYFNLGPHGVPSCLIPTLGEYANISWKPHNNSSLVYSGENFFNGANQLIFRSQLGRFNWEDLGNYKSIIHMPYEISTMSIAEHYSSGIPLHFPSAPFLLNEWHKNKDLLQSKYWFHKARTIYPIYLKNALAEKSEEWWVSRADFYNSLQNVNYFDSINNLLEDLMNIPREQLNYPTKKMLLNRRKTILDLWRINLRSISIG